MSNIENPSELRKTLLENGYVPLANIDKRCVLPNWPRLVVNEVLIDSPAWARGKHQATGLRVDRPLGVIDADITDDELISRLLDRWIGYLDYVFDGTPMLQRGTTASCKLAWFVRISKPFGRKATRAYRRADGKGDAQRVEIYGGKTPRQFGAFGAHKVDRGGQTLSEYDWGYESPLDTPISELPEVTPEQCEELIRIAEAMFKEAGLEPLELRWVNFTLAISYAGLWVGVRNSALLVANSPR